MLRSLQILKDIVDHTPLPIGVYTGSELKIEVANPAMIRTWGKGNDVLGKTYFDIVPEIEKQHIFDEALQVFNTGISFHAKDKRVNLIHDGEEKAFYFNYSFIPLFDAEGKVYAIMNTGMDVTDLHLAREKAHNSSEQLQMAIESSGMGTYEIDLLTKKITTSGKFQSIWNIDDTITNDKIISKLHPDDIKVREQAHQEAEQTGIISYEARIINEDKSIIWSKINGKIIKENDTPVKIIGVVEDIGYQKTLENELRKEAENTSEKLRKSNEELLHFANLVSHDLKEPVRKIETFISLLKKELQNGVTEKGLWYLDKVNHSAQRMQNLIEGILVYSGSNKKKQPVVNIDLDEILKDIKVDLELVIQEKGAVFISSDLPVIEGSKILIQQLLYNLIHNALKFSRAEVPPRIIITSKIITNFNGEAVQIYIEDNGIGLDNDFSERIFNAFERLHSKDEYEGSGLGLSLCRKITERHGGNITAFGKVDSGSVFTLILPLRQNNDTI